MECVLCTDTGTEQVQNGAYHDMIHTSAYPSQTWTHRYVHIIQYLVGKVLPKCNYCTGISHGIINEFDGGMLDDLGGTGQVNVFLGNSCR